MIELENGYFIQVDDMNHTLYTKQVSKEGNEYTRPVGYYSNIASALEGYYKICIAKKLDTDIFTLKEAIEIMKSERERIEGLIR